MGHRFGQESVGRTTSGLCRKSNSDVRVSNQDSSALLLGIPILFFTKILITEYIEIA
jgi:hypothetical protein